MSYIPSKSSSINVRTFGARGDGVTDDTAAIQRAINAAKTAEIGSIIFPDSTYMMYTAAQVFNQTGLDFIGENSFITTTGEGDHRKFHISGSKNINFIGLSFFGGKTGSATNGDNFRGIITYEDSQLGYVESCNFYNQRGSAVLCYGGTSDIRIFNNYFSGHFCGVYSYSKSSPTGVPSKLTITENNFGPTWAAGGETACIKLQNNLEYSPPSRNLVISNNNIASSCQMGIEIWNGIENASIVGNTISGTEWGISLDKTRNSVVANNTIVKNSFAGIEAATLCENLIINGNTIDNFADGNSGVLTAYGLLATNSGKNLTITNNFVRGTSKGVHLIGSVKNVLIDGNTFISNSITFNPQNAFSNITFSNNLIESGTVSSYLCLLDVVDASASGLFIRGNIFNGNATDQAIFYYNNNNANTIYNVLIEDNTVGPKGRGGPNGGDVFIGGQFTPSNYIYRDNFSVSGATTANSIADASDSTSSSFGNANIKNGISYYGKTQWVVPTGGITGGGIWLCVWSGGGGEVNNPRVRVQNYSSFDNSAATSEFWASCMPYINSNMHHQLGAIPQGTYDDKQSIIYAKTVAHESYPNNSLWVKIKASSTGAVGAPFDVWFSEQNLLTSVYSTYTEPTDTTNNAKLNLTGTAQLGRFKLSKGVQIGTGANSFWDAGNNGSIWTSGSIGIGTNTPTAQLHTTSTVRFANFGAGTATFDANGNISSVSDERFKIIKGPFTRGLTAITGVKPIIHTWRPESHLETEGTYYGFSAQQTAQHLPEAVYSGSNGYLSLADRSILAALVNAVTELKTEIDALKKGKK